MVGLLTDVESVVTWVYICVSFAVVLQETWPFHLQAKICSNFQISAIRDVLWKLFKGVFQKGAALMVGVSIIRNCNMVIPKNDGLPKGFSHDRT